MPPTATKPQLKKFRLLRGTHVQRHPDHPDDRTKDTTHRWNDPKTNIVLSDRDLVRDFGRLKFAYLTEYESQQIAENQRQAADKAQRAQGTRYNDALGELSLDDLKKVADDNEIDVDNCKTKEDYLEAIRKAV